MMNFCPKCGTAVKAGARFCPNCGFDLQVKGTPAAPTASASVQPAPQQQVQPQTQFQQQATMSAPIPQATGSGAVDYQSNLGLVGAFKLLMHDYAKYNGRMSRANYWWAYLAMCLIEVAAEVISYFIGSDVLTYVVNLFFIAPSVSSLARRLHDSNYSAWNISWLIIPVVGWIYFVVILCKPGDQQANRFG